MNFSICVIARNEEKTLPRLINSVKHWMKQGLEFNVLDTGSTDQTVEIAKSLGCRVLEVGDKFVKVIDQELADKLNSIVESNEKPIVKVGDRAFNFGDARNCVHDFSTTDFVFQIDADEVFTNLDANLIEHIISEGYNKCDYHYIYNHSTDGTPFVKQVRSYLYDRRFFKWEGMVHENLIPIPDTESKLCFIEEPFVLIEHWQNSQTNRTGYRVALALTYLLEPLYYRNYHFFGREMIIYGNYETALKILHKHLIFDCNKHEQGVSLEFIGDCYCLMGDDRGIEYYLKSFTFDGLRRTPLIKLAYHYLQKAQNSTKEERTQNLIKTICYATASLEIPWINFYMDDLQQYTYLPHELIYVSKLMLGDIIGAKEHWTKAKEYFPSNPIYIRDERYFTGDTNEKV